MKCLILLSLVMFVITEDIKCPADIDTTVSCTKEYTPVCGFSSDGNQQGTFENSCFACRGENVVYYQSDPCVMAVVYTMSSPDGTTTSSTAIYKCDLPKDGTVDCQQTKEQVCGLFNQNIQCFKAPCGQVYDNSCLACTSANVDTYFFGDCSQYPEQTNTPATTESEYVKCLGTRPEMCAELYTDTCAFTSYPCYSETCQKSVSSGCHACADQTVVGYVSQACSEYAQMYQTAMPGPTNNATDLGTADGSNQTNETTTEKVNEYSCSASRPTSCDDVVSEVCANYQCGDSKCKKEYSNECQACQDSTTLSYQRNKCDVSYGAIMAFAFIISILL